jgi:hypothetical protein
MLVREGWRLNEHLIKQDLAKVNNTSPRQGHAHCLAVWL